MKLPTSEKRRAASAFPISFATGMLAGLVFWILHEPSPAPPWQALAGLLGIVLGEHLALRVKQRSAPESTRIAPTSPSTDSTRQG